MSSPFFTVLPGHDLAYNEIVNPTRRWAFSYYYLYRWLPLLHPQQAMLVQVLRQCTWQNGKPTGRCQLANATLCRLMGWSESSHKTLLTELERPYSNWFLRRQRSRKRHVTDGHAVEGAPRYHVMMDDPLTPRDQQALHAILSRSHPATPYEAAELLAMLATHGTRELWTLLDDAKVEGDLPTSPCTVAEIAARAWPHLPGHELAHSLPFKECAERCQLKLVGAGYAHLELDYMLRGWLPAIGINNAWLTIVLRARCFHDPHSSELRDHVTISRKELEEQLGIPTRTFRRVLRDEVTIPLFHISPAGEAIDPENPRLLPHRGNLRFKVAYPLLPIAPQDRERYEGLLLGSSSTTGHKARLNTASEPGWSPELSHRWPSDPAEPGHLTRLNQQEAASEPGSNRPIVPAQNGISGQRTRLEPAIQPSIRTTPETEEPSEQKQAIPQESLGEVEKTEGRTEIRHLLEPFQIRGLNLVLQNADLTGAEVRGWIYRGMQEVSREQLGGYLFRRLRPGSEEAEADPLPEVFRLVGEVSEEENALFERWWLSEMISPPFHDASQRSRYAAWLQVIKQEEGNPERPDFSPHACWRREMERARREQEYPASLPSQAQ